MKFKFILLFIILSFQNSFGQHIDIDKKTLSFLTSEEKLNIEFTYDSLTFDNDNKEANFLEKMKVKIATQKNENEAKEWTLNYYKFKNEIWQNTFISTLNEKMSDYENAPVFEKNLLSATYTMKVNTQWMYFGYDAGIVDRPAKVTTILTFYKTNTPNNILFTTEISRAMGTYNKEDGDGEGVGPSLNRMNKAYTTAAYKLAKALKRVVD
jgi:hypothetical protein